MENNNNKESLLINTLSIQLQNFGKKCLEYILQKKLDIEEEKIFLYINEDVLMRFLRAREGDETKAFAMWSQWADWRAKYKPESIDEKDIKNELKTGKASSHSAVAMAENWPSRSQLSQKPTMPAPKPNSSKGTPVSQENLRNPW